MRAALRWSIQRGEVGVGLRLAVATYAFWYQRGSYTEGRAWFAELLAQPGGADGAARAYALLMAAQLTNQQGVSTAS